MRGLERWDDPRQAGQLAESLQRLLVGHGLIASAAAVSQERVLGTGARIVKPGRDRVRLQDLSLLILHHRRARAVQDARPPAHGQGRAVTAGLDPLAARLHSPQLDLLIVEARRKPAERVAAAAATGPAA